MRRGARALTYAGTAAAVLAFAKLHAKYVGDYDLTTSSRFSWTITFVALLCLGAYSVGLPDLPRTTRERLSHSFGAVAVGAGAISLIQLAAGSALLPRFVVFWSSLLLIFWYALCASLADDQRERQERRDRVVFVMTNPDQERLSWDVERAPERPASIAAVLSPAEAASEGHLHAVVESEGASVVVLDRTAQDDSNVIHQAASLHEKGVRIRTLSLFYEEWIGKLPLAELERASLLFDISELHNAYYGRIKRISDIAVGVVALIFLVALTPLVILGNVFANRGRLFFSQERVGKNGHVFRMHKFRTMRRGTSAEWTVEGDKRITPFGRILRRTHVDELPQSWNLIRGDLAVVGPRPEQPSYVHQLSVDIPFYDLRHLVRPGITGWAQVNYAYGSSAFDALEKLQFEFYYLRHQSLSLDLRIVGRTLRSVARLGGR